MEQSIYKFILKYSLRQQVILTILSFTSFIPYYYYLLMPKLIVNQGISHKNVEFPYTFLGIEIGPEMYLVLLCLAFLALVVVQQGYKYAINVYQGISGERMLRRLRYILYGRVLRFPLPTFRRMSQGEIIPMIVAETESLGGFIAESFAVPLFQGGMFLVSLGFLFAQNWGIALAALALYPVQLYVIPKMQRRVNRLGKERVKTARKLADRIGESIQGVQEIHANHGSKPMLAVFSARLGDIYWLRYEIFQRKFMIKFLNNFLQQAGPFTFYLIGGYLAIKNQLDVGTVVAAVAAHKEMGAPLKELLNHYQQREDARIKYETIVSQFDPPGIREAAYQQEEPENPPKLDGDLQVSALSYVDDQDSSVFDGLSLTFPAKTRTAVLATGAGREELMMLLARLLDPSKGRITVGGTDLGPLPESVTGTRIAFVGTAPYVFNASVEQNLFLGLRHRQLTTVDYEGEAGKRWQLRVRESEASGNSADDVDADWIDYGQAGTDGREALNAEALRVLRVVGFYEDVYQLGLRGSIAPKREPDLAAAILRARAGFREKLAQPGIANLVEAWDRAKFNRNASVADNLLFGLPVGEGFDIERLAENAYVLEVLEKVGLTKRFLEGGRQVAETMVELFADLPPDHEFFQQFSFISSDDLPEFQALLTRVPKDRPEEANQEDRRRLMSLPFKLIPARHRVFAFDAELEAKILEAREVFARDLPDNLAKSIAFFDPEQYTAAANILDNILFGKVVYGQAQAAEQVSQLVGEVLDALKLRDTVARVGFAFECGIAGGRLSAAQRQRLGLARAMLKRADIVILSDSTSALDGASQAQVMEALLAELKDRTVVATLPRASLAKRFDRIVVLDSGKVVEQGNVADLDREGTHFRRLLANE